MKRQFTTGVLSKTSPHFIVYNFSVGSYTEFVELKFKASSKSVDSARWNMQENYL